MPDDNEVAAMFREETGGTGQIRSTLDLPDSYGETHPRIVATEVDPNNPEAGQIEARGSQGPRDMLQILAGKPST